MKQFNKRAYTIRPYGWIAILAFLFLTANTHAQVRIGGDVLPQPGAVLDLHSADYIGGLKLPNINLPDLGKIPASFTAFSSDVETDLNLKGMLAYNTNETTGLGVYYWDGEDWNKVNTAGGGMTISPYPPAPIVPGGGTTPPVTVTDPSCTISGNYSYLVIAGQDYASVEPTSSDDGIFAVTFQANNTAFERKAVIMITNPCGENSTFVFTQTGAPCPGTHANPTLNASSGTICDNGMFYAFVTNADPAASYIWTKNNVVVNTGIAFQTNQPGSYQVYTDLVGCGSPASITLTKDNGSTSESPVTISATNDGVICDGGGSVTLTAFNVPASTTVNWYKEGVLKSTGNPLVLNNATTDAGTWFAAIGSGTACYSTPSNQVVVTTSSATALATPQFTINGLDPSSAVYCQGGLLELRVTTNYSAVLGITYQWYVNGTAAAAPSTSPVYYTVPVTGELNFAVVVTKSGFCSSSAASPTQTVTFTASPETNINQGEKTFICGGSPAVLRAGVSGASEYQWFREVNGVDTKITTEATGTFTTTTEGKYKVTYRDGQGCYSKLSTAIDVELSNSLAVNFVNLPTQVNQNDVITFSTIATPEPDSFSWSATNGATAAPIGTGASANVTFPNLGPTDITVAAQNGCGQVVKTTSVTVLALCTGVSSVALSPAGNFTVKAGTAYGLTATPNGSDLNRNYNWFVNGVSVQNGPSNTFNFLQASAGTFTVYVTVSNDCGSATSATLTATVTPDITQYTDYTGAATLTGKTCFDVVMINNGGSCGDLVNRTNDFASSYNFDYTFTGTGYTNLIFALDDGSVITNGITTNGTIGTIRFKPDTNPEKTVGGTRAAAAGTDNTTAKTVIVYALFEIGAVKYKVGLPLSVRDCICCPGYLAKGGEYTGPATSNLGGQGMSFAYTVPYFTATGNDICFYKKDSNNGSKTTQTNAIAACKNASFFDGDGAGMTWRLPNVAELGALNTIAHNGASGAVNQGIGAQPTAVTGTKNMLIDHYWSITVKDASYGWIWSYSNNYSGSYLKTANFNVRCVK